MKKDDKLVTYSIKEPNQISEDMIKHFAVSTAQEKGLTKQPECIILEKEGGKKVCEQLRDYIYDTCSDIKKHGYVDFVAIGNTGMSFASSPSKYLGSVANEVLRMKKLNTIFIS